MAPVIVGRFLVLALALGRQHSFARATECSDDASCGASAEGQDHSSLLQFKKKQVPSADLFLRDILDHSLAFWSSFYDWPTGLWCDTSSLTNPGCTGDYSIAAVGFGLLIDCVWAEVADNLVHAEGAQPTQLTMKMTKSEVADRTLRTLRLVASKWPRDHQSGFLAHYVGHVSSPDEELVAKRDGSSQGVVGGSTIDTSEFILGAAFARNYLRSQTSGVTDQQKDEISSLLKTITDRIDWVRAIDVKRGVAMMFRNGISAGYTKPFNEYFLVSYAAKVFAGHENPILSHFFDQFYYPPTGGGEGTGWPEGGNLDGQNYPKRAKFGDYTFITDQNAPTNMKTIQPSFVYHFCQVLSKSFQQSKYYQWTLSDMGRSETAFWRDFTRKADELHYLDGLRNYLGSSFDTSIGAPYFWGSGAGLSPFYNHTTRQLGNDVYGVGHINNNIEEMLQQPAKEQQGNAEVVYSPAAMAGFLLIRDSEVEARLDVVDRLKRLWAPMEISVNTNDKDCWFQHWRQWLLKTRNNKPRRASLAEAWNGNWPGLYVVENLNASITSARVLWRASLRWFDWKASSASAIDYSTFITGVASRFLDKDFYLRYAS